jgi:hypothetical protein
MASAQTPTCLLKGIDTTCPSVKKCLNSISITVYGDLIVDKPEYAGNISF